MDYLYHMVPKDQQGTILEPLNRLKESRPDLYAEKVKKYDGREHVMERTIPILECLWNDVLHLSPIPPSELKTALLEAGIEDREFNFYKIDPYSLELNKTVVYMHRTTDKLIPPDHSEFVRFSPELLENIKDVPKVSKEYFREKYSAGEKPLLFLGIPHILYKGEIDVSNVEIVTV